MADEVGEIMTLLKVGGRSKKGEQGGPLATERKRQKAGKPSDAGKKRGATGRGHGWGGLIRGGKKNKPEQAVQWGFVWKGWRTKKLCETLKGGRRGKEYEFTRVRKGWSWKKNSCHKGAEQMDFRYGKTKAEDQIKQKGVLSQRKEEAHGINGNDNEVKRRLGKKKFPRRGGGVDSNKIRVLPSGPGGEKPLGIGKKEDAGGGSAS